MTTNSTLEAREPGTVKTARSVTLKPYTPPRRKGMSPAEVKALPAPVTLPVTVTAVYVGEHAAHNDGATGWNRGPWHLYAVTVADPASGEIIQTTYREGMGHVAGRADPAEIVASLLNDASSVMPYLEITQRNAPPMGKLEPHAPGAWQSWAADLGYPEDSRAARGAFRACTKTANRLRAMLGDDLYTSALEIAGEL